MIFSSFIRLIPGLDNPWNVKKLVVSIICKLLPSSTSDKESILMWVPLLAWWKDLAPAERDDFPCLQSMLK